MRTWFFLALCIAVSFELGCGAAIQQVSKRAAQGAVEGAKRGARAAAGPLSTEQLGRQMVRGTLGELSQEEQLDELGRVVHRSVAKALEAATQPRGPSAVRRAGGEARRAGSEANGATGPGDPSDRSAVGLLAAQTAQAFSEGIARELGESGGGPLAVSISGAAERIAGAALRGADDAMPGPFPECRGEGRTACVQRRLEELSRVVSAGVARGVWDGFKLGFLAVAFGLGVVVAVAVACAIAVLRAHRTPPGGAARVTP
jgi:hypothetical protein